MQYGNHMKCVWEVNYCFTQMWTSANQGCFTERQSWTIFSTASLQCVRIPCRSSMQPSMYTWPTMHCKQDICIIIMQPSPTINNFKILSKTSLLYKILAMNIFLYIIYVMFDSLVTYTVSHNPQGHTVH